MMTGFAGEDLIKAALAEGVIDVLRKPVMPEDILARLSRTGKQSLLIADDDDEYAETFAAYLTRMGWTTKRARNGAEAVAMATSETFAALLLDLKMPSLSGLEVLAALKAAGRMVPTIVVTGNYDEADVIPHAELHGYVRKPIDPRDLLILIERAAEHSVAA
jgi:DNA-binding response OmpR family regulator